MDKHTAETAKYLAEVQKTDLAIGQAIAIVIRTAQMAAQIVGVTEADLKQFEHGLSMWDSIGPLLHPTAWRDTPREQTEESKARTKLLRDLLKLSVNGDGCLLDSHMAPVFGGDGVLKGYLVAPTLVEVIEELNNLESEDGE